MHAQKDEPVGRIEDFRHLTGRACFTDDLVLENMAYGHVVRSPHAHAEVRSIHTDGASSQPDVLAIITGHDLVNAGVGSIPCLFPLEQVDGSPMIIPRRPALALDRVRHIGDPVAFVVAETPAAAKNAAELVEVDFRPLAAVTDAVAAIIPGAPSIWPQAEHNICYRWAAGDAAATDACFAKAARVVHRRLVYQRIVINPIEPRVSIGTSDDGTLILHTPSQGAHFLRDQLIDIFGCAEDKLHVVTPDVGGAFGMKLFLHPEQILVLDAARRLDRPVKWTADRSESFISDNQARDQVFDMELALDATGYFLALRLQTTANLGAYVSNYAPCNSVLGVDSLPGPYDISAAHVEVTAAFTNTVPVDAYRGAGRAEVVYPLECLVDAAARELKMDPVELRRRNFVPPSGALRTNCMGLEVEARDYEHTLSRALAVADLRGVTPTRSQVGHQGTLRGFGLACYATVAMGGEEHVSIEVSAEGEVTVLIGTQSSGQGHETAFAGVVAEELGIEIDRVRVVEGDTRRISIGMMTGGSRSIPTGVGACKRGVNAWIQNARGIASALLQTGSEQIDFARGAFVSRESGAQLRIEELVRTAAEAGFIEACSNPRLAVDESYDLGKWTHPSGCHVCEVEIDKNTGGVRLLRYISVDDVGRVLSPVMAIGQLHGGVAQGLGQAVLERCVYDADSGQLLSGSLLDYTLPRADDIPFLDTYFDEAGAGEEQPPLRGVGEMGAIAAPPAIMNAVMDALGQAGVSHLDMPATPEQIWRACHDAGRS